LTFTRQKVVFGADSFKQQHPNERKDGMSLKLHDLEVTRSDYEAMPVLDGSSDEYKFMPINSYFRTKDGRVCKVVKGIDMFCDQAGAALLSLPEIGLRHYNPVFTA
jgi:hypothetical protein